MVSLRRNHCKAESAKKTNRWGAIAVVTVAIRLCLSRLVISGQKHNVRLQAVQPQMNRMMERIKQASAEGDQQSVSVLGQTLKNLMAEHQVSPLKPMMVPLAQLPVFIAMFYGLRRMAEAPFPQLKEGGFGWVMDLTLPDPYYILPITSMVLTNIVLRVSENLLPHCSPDFVQTGADGTAVNASQPWTRHLPNLIGLASLAAIPIIGRFPAVSNLSAPIEGS